MSAMLADSHASTETANRPAASRHNLPTRLLHAALLLSVIWQLIGSNLMHHPKVGRPGDFFYEVHEIVGLLTLGLVLAFWLWAAVRRRGTPLAALLPWFSGTRRSVLMDDLQTQLNALRKRRLPTHGVDSPLACAVHGLGLLTALGMAATGSWMYAMDLPGGLPLDAHKLIANLMWAYLIGHAGVALLYQFTRQPVLKDMFAGDSAQRVHPNNQPE